MSNDQSKTTETCEQCGGSGVLRNLHPVATSGFVRHLFKFADCAREVSDGRVVEYHRTRSRKEVETLELMIERYQEELTRREQMIQTRATKRFNNVVCSPAAHRDRLPIAGSSFRRFSFKALHCGEKFRLTIFRVSVIR